MCAFIVARSTTEDAFRGYILFNRSVFQTQYKGVVLLMSDVAMVQSNSAAWSHRLVRLLLVVAFSLTGLVSAQATAERDHDSHIISIHTTLPAALAMDGKHEWDPDAPLPIRLLIERVYTTWPSVAETVAPQCRPLTAFTARAPPSSAPHTQIV